jgi:hypothetical protein
VSSASLRTAERWRTFTPSNLLKGATSASSMIDLILSVAIVRLCGRSSKHRTLNLARLCLNLQRWDYWMPRLKRGMTTESFAVASDLRCVIGCSILRHE